MPPRLTALRSLFVMAQHYGIQISSEQLANADEENVAKSVLLLMRDVGLTGKLIRNQKWNDLIALGSAYPAMVERRDGSWVIVVGIFNRPDAPTAIAIFDPRQEQSGTILIDQGQFEGEWNGKIILCKRHYKLSDEHQPFGFRWFMPLIIKNGRYMRDMAILSMATALITFTTPLFFNIMLDKVVPHQAYNTLFALTVIFITLAVFDAIFQYTRQILTLFVSNKVDAHLASKTYDYLLRLPLQFFESVPTGVLIRHMQQTETIRGFLIGQLFHTLLDISVMPVLLIGLFFYSFKLTAVVLAFSLVISAVIAGLIPIFRRLLDQVYQAEGSRQADLVETVSGMRAVKSLALENLRKKSWDNKVVNAIRTRTTVFYFSTAGLVVVQVLQKLMTITIMCLGITSVFDGELTIGGLVAFFMLSGNVTGPLLQIVGLINEYQQVALSVKMLGTVMNHPPERGLDRRGIHPPITGEMEFSEVMFRYEGSVTPALDRISFRVEEGQVIGVVGRSGSGKTTVTRLIQGINEPQEGLIRLSGTDVRHIDLTYLRKNIGVVLQENILFRGTIRDNIAATKPDAALDDVMQAARLAGADEFIDRLPRSYETFVEESATNFSGGQRQRLAIARALLSRPRLLIFDEATSALDPDSEAIIQQNLADIARGRTMVIVSHRLSSLVSADAILVLERGLCVDFAPHDVLLERCDVYRHLWQQQTRHML